MCSIKDQDKDLVCVSQVNTSLTYLVVFGIQGPQSSREIMTDFAHTANPPTSCHCLSPLTNQLQSNTT